ncbi:hypothetical protein [Metabacillus malikii]|uniref:DUF3139 domain-containing protein n=1 Tax=Metabacillus malikii TaxID=1504265 RepID=A0ABT9ZIH5_9BACI|nr:hypothetical protein [Metabacillus malikii]MDQ0232078.1 hypothetical protein [Metabacillus malikii]
MRKVAVLSIVVTIVLGLIALNFLGPYNILSALSANNLAKYEKLQQQVDGEIIDITYVGGHTYHIQTKKKNYVLIDKSDDLYKKFEVYELHNEVEIFKNPM